MQLAYLRLHDLKAPRMLRRPNNVRNTVVNGVEKDEDVTVRPRPAFCVSQG